MKSLNKSLIIWGCFLLLTLSWGSSFILVKRALQGGFTGVEVASLRMLAAFAVLAVPAALNVRRLPADKLPYVVLSGWLSMLIPAYLFSTAQMHIESAVTSILNALTPAFTFLLGIALFGQRPKGTQIAGLLTGFIGSLLLIGVQATGHFSVNPYALLVMGATLCYGLNVNMLKGKLHDVRPLQYSTVAVAVAGLTAGAILLVTGDRQHIKAVAQEHPWALGAIVLLGAMSTAFAQIVFNYLLTLTSPVFASAITYFIPIVAVLWGVWDGEVLLIWHYLGMAFIIGGILILNRAR